MSIKRAGETWVLVCVMLFATACDNRKPAGAPINPDTLVPQDARLAQLYRHSCQACHAQPGGVAPMVGDTKVWQPLLDKGVPLLLQSVKAGTNGMPAGGLCVECTDTDYTELILFMSQAKKDGVP